jgi:sugar/nucleoside kinase (ribokinase family)
MFDIITVGHLSIDFIKLHGGHVTKRMLGGSPVYVSIAAKKLGAKVSLISKVGGDFPSKHIRRLKNSSIDLSGLEKIEGALTTRFVLDYSRVGKRMLILKSRAPPIEARDIPDFSEAKAVHIAPIANEVSSESLLRLRGLASLVSLDPQGFVRRFEKNGAAYLHEMENPEILGKIDVFKGSQNEVEAVAGKSDLTNAIRRIYEYGVKIVIITRGAEGALLYFKGKMYRVPASKPRIVVDTTGSGDVFIGAFLTEYVQGKDPLWCASVGSPSASFVVEKLGPRGFGSEREVYERATEVYEKTSIVTRA